MGPDNLPAEPNTTRATLTAALVAALRTPNSLCKVFVFLTNPPSAKAVLPFAPTTGNRHSPGRPIRLLEFE